VTDRSWEIDMEALFAEHGRISTFSVPENCVEVAPMPGGESVAIRNHNQPQQGWIVVDRPAFGDLLTRCKSGAFDALLL
jgi:hypothetical protein